MCSNKARWAVAAGELLKWSRELTNVSARNAIAVIKEGMTNSHIPHKILKVRFVFMTSDVVINGKVTGAICFSDDMGEKFFHTRTIFEWQIF